jgi:hypothetical protein
MMIRAPSTLIPASLVLVACATLGGIRSEPLDNGVANRFPVPFDSVMAVVPEAVVAAGLGLKESPAPEDSPSHAPEAWAAWRAW